MRHVINYLNAYQHNSALLHIAITFKQMYDSLINIVWTPSCSTSSFYDWYTGRVKEVENGLRGTERQKGDLQQQVENVKGWYIIYVVERNKVKRYKNLS